MMHLPWRRNGLAPVKLSSEQEKREARKHAEELKRKARLMEELYYLEANRHPDDRV